MVWLSTVYLFGDGVPENHALAKEIYLALRRNELIDVRPIETVLEMIPRDTWDHISRPVNQLRAWQGLPYDVDLPRKMLKICREQGGRCMDCGVPFCHTGQMLEGGAAGQGRCRGSCAGPPRRPRRSPRPGTRWGNAPAGRRRGSRR